jgi:hypothetical protein
MHANGRTLRSVRSDVAPSKAIFLGTCGATIFAACASAFTVPQQQRHPSCWPGLACSSAAFPGPCTHTVTMAAPIGDVNLSIVSTVKERSNFVDGPSVRSSAGSHRVPESKSPRD